jgi:hypothetical protein
MAAVATLTLVGCVPQPPTPSAAPPTSSQAADLCDRLVRVFGERIALADAFRSLIADDRDAAADKARRIRSRLEDIIDDLPVPTRVPQSRAALRDAIQDWAGLLDGAAAIIDVPTAVNREVVLSDGRAVLPLIDEILHPLPSGDPITLACPDVVSPSDAVDFPPPPTNEALGLPDTVGDLDLEPHVTRPSTQNSKLLTSLGLDPQLVREIAVDVTNTSMEGGFSRVDVLEPIPTETEALAEAVREALLPEASASAPEMIARFEVYAYRDADLGTIHVAMRGDRVVILYDLADAAVREILDAMPFELPSYGG